MRPLSLRCSIVSAAVDAPVRRGECTRCACSPYTTSTCASIALCVQVPIGITRLFQHPTLDWNLKTTSDMYLARGKLLGGSSSTNATLYHRGSADDYDAWGLPGWKADDVLPWFKRAEDNPAFKDSQWHATGPFLYQRLCTANTASGSIDGSVPTCDGIVQATKQMRAGAGGAMHVERPLYQNKLFDAHFKASTELGLKPNDDFNDWSHPQDGFGEFQVCYVPSTHFVRLPSGSKRALPWTPSLCASRRCGMQSSVGRLFVSPKALSTRIRGVQVSITARGRRADGHRQYLKPALGRDNLTVVTRAQTKRVLFEQRGGKPCAVGVEVHSVRVRVPHEVASAASGGRLQLHISGFPSVMCEARWREKRPPSCFLCVQPGAATLSTGRSTTVSVNDGGEVLLAAGAIHSPQVLMLSGIGPKAHLQSVGVPVVADSAAVGSNLQDHPAVLSAYTLKDSAGRISITDHIYRDDGSIRKRQLLNWALLGRGPLTSTACDRGAFVRTTDSAKLPDLQVRYVAGLALNPDGVGSFVDFGRMKVCFCAYLDSLCPLTSAALAAVRDISMSWRNTTAGCVQESGEINRWPSGITFQIIACRPQSRGSVRLTSASVSDRPLVDVGYLSDKGGADAATLREGLRLSRKLTETEAWQELLEEEMHPGPASQSDSDLDAYIAKTMHSANALTGTCALGAPGKGVVSPSDFTVHGVQGLRVVDSSVIPTIPGGQTGAPTVMIAERAAALLTAGEAAVTGVEPALAMA